METKKQSKTPAVRKYTAEYSTDGMTWKEQAALYRKKNPEIITTPARELALSYPDELNDILKRIQEWTSHPQGETGLTPLEYILRKFEEEAGAILKANRRTADVKKLKRLQKQQEGKLSIIEHSAIQVLTSARIIRTDIKKQDATGAAIETLKLFCAAVCAELHDTIITGARLKAGQKSKKPPRASLAIKEAMKTLLKKHPAYNYMQAWDSFKQNHRGLEKALQIELNKRTHHVFFADPENALVEIQFYPWAMFKDTFSADDIEATKHIGKDRFKKYFHEVKKQTS